MMGLELTILGCHSASPRAEARPTAQLLDISGHLFLIDCGEGTQVALRQHRIKFARIKHIFISHLHGDHYFGLIGLISTLRLLGREEPLHIYGPKGLKEIITLQLRLGKSWTNFPLLFQELNDRTSVMVYEDDAITVETLPLDHRVYTNGFLFKAKPGERILNREAAEKAGISPAYYKKLKQGYNVPNEQGAQVDYQEVTNQCRVPVSYAYCSDTAYLPSLADLIKGVSVLYHESTFLNAQQDLCDRTKHSTAQQAALIAKEAQARFLILGHYSGRYADVTQFRDEALTYFDQVYLAEDGRCFNLPFGDANGLTQI
ncbi:MAG: ribonuclease Z [Flavobacteriaceae bacterium]|jgi:ribonuclease Z|tara:strand:+ start:11472 stop:12419 length:948 start_codon:yes stop_codon:yes gene_type:complete